MAVVTELNNDHSVVGTQDKKKFSKLIRRRMLPEKIGKALFGKITDPYKKTYLQTKTDQASAVQIEFEFTQI